MRKAFQAFALVLAFFLLCGFSHGRGPQTYTVSNSGSDSNDGLSAPWATLGHLTSASFNSGDTIQLDSASTFSGGIALTPANAPGYLTLTTTAAGQPTINSGSTYCVKALYMPGMNVNNFKCVGGGISFPTICGMYFIGNSDANHGASLANMPKLYLEGPKLTNNTVSQYGADGIFVDGSDQIPNNAGYVWVTANNNVVHDVALSGFCSNPPGQNQSETAAINISGGGTFGGAAASYSIFNVQVNNNTLTNIAGFGPSPSGAPTDQVIALTQVNTALTQFNYIKDFGYGTSVCPSGVGIIAYDSSFVTMQFNEATGGIGIGCDGEGFDFDGNVSNSVMQFNYAHNNAGSEILDCNGCSTNTGDNNNTIYRFNIAEQGAGQGMQMSVSHNTVNTQIYNNTIVGHGGGIFTFETAFGNPTATGNFAANNIIYTSAAATSNIVSALNVGGLSSPLVLTGNLYFAAGGGTYQFGPIFGTTYTGLAAFQAAGYEKVGSTPVGVVANPNLTSIGGNVLCATAPSGAGWTALCPTGYDLTAASPAGKTNGLNLNTVYGINVGSVDYFGNAVTNTTLPIGAAANK
jgi:hypothetical protein